MWESAYKVSLRGKEVIHHIQFLSGTVYSTVSAIPNLATTPHCSVGICQLSLNSVYEFVLKLLHEKWRWVDLLSLEKSRTCSKKPLINSKRNMVTSFLEYVATGGPSLVIVTYF